MILKKEMSFAVIFLAAAIIFVSSTPMANNAFAQTEGEEEDIVQTELADNSIQTAGEDNSGSKNYENFLDCLSNASASGIPAGDEIMNCVEESGYIQGTPDASSAADTADETENVPVSVVGDESDEDEDESDEDEDESDEDEDESDEDEDKQ
jgi:hypothetical protein